MDMSKGKKKWNKGPRDPGGKKKGGKPVKACQEGQDLLTPQIVKGIHKRRGVKKDGKDSVLSQKKGDD